MPENGPASRHFSTASVRGDLSQIYHNMAHVIRLPESLCALFGSQIRDFRSPISRPSARNPWTPYNTPPPTLHHPHGFCRNSRPSNLFPDNCHAPSMPPLYPPELKIAGSNPAEHPYRIRTERQGTERPRPHRASQRRRPRGSPVGRSCVRSWRDKEPGRLTTCPGGKCPQGPGDGTEPLGSLPSIRECPGVADGLGSWRPRAVSAARPSSGPD